MVTLCLLLIRRFCLNFTINEKLWQWNYSSLFIRNFSFSNFYIFPNIRYNFSSSVINSDHSSSATSIKMISAIRSAEKPKQKAPVEKSKLNA